MVDDKKKVTLSLISHTNVGKTTLARTLLRKDIGDVRDDTHVTDMNEVHLMLKTEEGFVLELWDTPGFGNSARLLNKLKDTPRPTGWFLEEVWDRFKDKSQWCNQQAIRNVSEDADVVLYLVNAAEDPVEAGYVDCEMQILEWLSKPVIVLLNQIGPPREAEIEAEEEKQWECKLQRFEVVKFVMSLDAFARCWVQEDQLMKAIEGVLSFAKRKPFKKIWNIWNGNNIAIFERSVSVLSQHLAAVCCDREPLSQQKILELIQPKLPFPAVSTESRKERTAAMEKLVKRMQCSVKESLDELIKLHQLEGQAATEILNRMSSDFSSNKPVNEGISAIIGGFITGAVSGIGADFMSGGLTFGGGAVFGGIFGAVGASGLARGYNLIRGDKTPCIRWSLPLLKKMFQSALLRYLAVSHFGRGRGEYTEGEYPDFWKSRVKQITDKYQSEIKSLWETGKRETNVSKLTLRFEKTVSNIIRQLLSEFYTDVKPFEQ